MSRATHYTADEIATVRATPQQIAEALNRSVGSIYERCRRLGLKIGQPKRREGDSSLEPSTPRRFFWQSDREGTRA